jgi:predicted DNA-binding transcriptional regulator AlpA
MPIKDAPSLNSRKQDTSATSGPDERLLRMSEVVKTVGFSRSTIHKKVATGAFPAPLKPHSSNSSRWLASEVQGYIEAAVSARDRARAASRHAQHGNRTGS